MTEGWAFPAGSRKAHYMRDSMSLCRKYGFYFGRLEADDGKPGPDDCAACRKELDKENPAAEATTMTEADAQRLVLSAWLGSVEWDYLEQLRRDAVAGEGTIMPSMARMVLGIPDRSSQ